MRLIALILVTLPLLFQCAKEREYSSEKSPSSRMASEPAKAMVYQSEEQKPAPDNYKDQPKQEFKPFEISNSIEAKDRLLEYRLSLSYECKDIIKTRQTLYPIINKYGFLKSSTTSMEGKYPFMTLNIAVKTSYLYEALLELEKLGSLVYEQITAIDHTEPMMWNKIRMFREQIRISRKNKALSETQSASKNWEARELLLEKSENDKDQADFQEWKIKDAVSWSHISISLKSPSLPDQIKIPDYVSALKKALEILLYIGYVLIYFLPFILLFILFYSQRKRISRWFKKKE